MKQLFLVRSLRTQSSECIAYADRKQLSTRNDENDLTLYILHTNLRDARTTCILLLLTTTTTSIYNTHTHTYTHTHQHCDYLKLNLHSLKRAINRDLRWMKTATRNRKHGRSTVFLGEKTHVFRLHLNESREGFRRRRRGRSFHVDGPKTEKAREPTGIWRLRISEAEH